MITGLDMPSVATTLPDRGMGSISDGNAKYGYPMNLDAGAAHLHAEFTGYQVYDEDLTLVEGETMMHNIMMKPL